MAAQETAKSGVRNLKRKATERLNDPIRRLYLEEAQEMPIGSAALAHFPALPEIQRTLQRRRQALQPPLPPT
jgi:hypothetical protein